MKKIRIPKEMKSYTLSEFFWDPEEQELALKAINYIEEGNYPYYSQESYDINKVKRGHFVSFSGCTTIDDAIKVLNDLKSQGYTKLIPDYCSLYGEGDFAYKLVDESKQEYARRVSEIIKDAINALIRIENKKKLEKIKDLESQISEIKKTMYK